MTMFINANRINNLLKSIGFHFWLADDVSGEFRWSRPTASADLFEHVWFTAYGGGKNVVGSFSAVAVIAGPEPKEGLYVERYNESLCSERRVFKDPSGRVFTDCHTIIKDAAQALSWEAAFIEISLRDASKLASEEGVRLLSVSQRARDAAKHYLRLLRSISPERNCDFLEQHLRKGAAEAVLCEADRLADAAVGRGKFLSAYQAASLAIQLFAKEVEGRCWSIGLRYSENPEFAWRLAILADMLMRESTKPPL